VHLAITYDKASGVARIFVNGIYWVGQTVGSFTPQTTGTLAFGAPSNSYFKGQLDEISLYTRALSASEILSIYNAGALGKPPVVVNQAPLVSAGADRSVVLGSALALTATALDDGLPNPPAALTYAWSKVSGPGNVIFSDPAALNPTATFDTLGASVLRLTVGDSELTASDDIQVTVTPPPPTVAITSPHDGGQIVANYPALITATAASAVGTVNSVEFFRDGVSLGLGGQVVGQPGVWGIQRTFGLSASPIVLTAKATASTGLSTTSAPVAVTVITDPGIAPDVVLSAPADGSTLTAPASVTGIVNSLILSSWTLDYRLKAATDVTPAPWTTLASGTTNVGTPAASSDPAVPGPLGTLDPTLLLNGIYELRLRAADAAGRSVTAGPITVVIEGNMKIGAFTLAFEDLNLPFAGIPIQVIRTYDSRDARLGDFGPGWHIAVNNIRVQKNAALAPDWEQLKDGSSFSTVYHIDPTRKHVITVVFPDGQTHRFEAGIYVPRTGGPALPDNYQWLVPITEGRLVFKPIGDTTSTLSVDGDNAVYFTGSLGEDYLTQGIPGVDEPFEPTRFRLTAKDGTVYILDERLGLLEMRDLNGNTLILNRDAQNRVNSIVSTQNAAGGPIVRTVTVHRDATGRVDYISDPAAQDLDYLYDDQGRLSSFANRELNVTQFFYENAAFPYYLTRIVDPRGVTALRSEFDADGRLVKQIDADGNEIVFNRGIDATGRFEKVKDRLGYETTYYYDDRGNILLKIDPAGAQTSYAYYPDGDLVKFEIDHYGNVKAFAYDARGNVTVETVGASTTEDPASPTTGYTTRTAYNNLSAPTSITDPDGRVQTFTYNSATNNLLTHTVGVGGPAPATTTYTYNADSTLATITDALSNVTSHTYDYAFSDPAYPGAVKKVTVTVTDPAGAAGSDPANATATVLRATRTLSDAQENQVAQIVTRTLPAGGTEDVATRYIYDTENRLVATILPDGKVTETRYNAVGKQSASVLWKSYSDYQGANDSMARVTAYGYDDRGNQTTVTNPDGTSEVTHYDAENRRDSSQDRLGRTTSYQYDTVGRLRFTIQPGGASTETVYDLVGRVTDSYDELRTHTQYVYYPDGTPDASRRHQVILAPASSTPSITTYQYDHAGNVRYVTDPRGNTVETQYDESGRPRLVIYPATDEHPSTQTETQYNALGQRIAVIDQEGKITRYRYDGLGRLIEVRQYLDAATAASDSDYSLPATHSSLLSTRYTYDELGNQTSQTDALGRVTAYHTDSAGHRVKRILPKDASEASALSETLDYDDWGNLWKRTDFTGKTTVFTYDAQNRLKTKSADATHPSLLYGHAIARIEYDYDANGARTAARTYNKDNLLLYTESTPRTERGWVDYKDVGGTRLDYSNYDNGLLKDVVSSSANGVNLGYRYDELNRLAYVDDSSGAAFGAVHTTSYTCNPNGSLETVTAPNGVKHAYAYDTLNRLRTLSVINSGNSILHAYEYKLYPSGHRHQVVEGGAPATPRTTTYTYDGLYRLTSETVSGAADPGQNGTVGYTLDKVGNRLSRLSSLPSVNTQDSTYNVRDWLNTDTYDANGNTTVGQVADLAARGTDTYDFENRLILRTRPDGTQVNVSYDADGNRIQKTLLATDYSLLAATHYLVDTNNPTGYAQVFEETTTDASGTTTKIYTYGSDLISQADFDAGSSLLATHYYAYDGHGSVRELTDEAGVVTDTYTYDAFGVLVFSHAYGSEPTANSYLYCAQQWDADLGLYFLRARYLNPDSGRFWSMDSYEGSNGDPASLHKYLYANANPVMRRDPSGKEATLAEMSFVGAAIGLTLSMALPSTQRIIRDAGEVVSGLAGEIGDSALGKAQAALAMSAAAVATMDFSLHEELDNATEELRRLGRRMTPPKIIPMPRQWIPFVAQHVADAQTSGHPAILTRTTPADARVNRRAATGSLPPAGIGLSWDEYPFASSTRGGYGASVRQVPLYENLVQGGIIGACYMLEEINVGDSFLVIVTP
jgi:RHS repeat-associated protein